MYYTILTIMVLTINVLDNILWPGLTLMTLYTLDIDSITQLLYYYITLFCVTNNIAHSFTLIQLYTTFTQGDIMSSQSMNIVTDKVLLGSINKSNG